jgi:8-amino-7-oxononanoate synthase
MDHPSQTLQLPLEIKLAAKLDRRRSTSLLRNLTVSPPGAIDFSSNDFLSLSTSKTLRQQYIKELNSQPASSVLGSGGSRLLDGNSRYAEDLERDIAAFHNAPTGLLFNSGFDANAGFFACIPQPGDIVLYDAFIHASVHDGMRLSRAARCLPFAHNSTSDLRSQLQNILNRDAAVRDGSRHVFVAVEAVYSMDGDLAPLAEMVDTVESLLPCRNGHIVVDEAHSTGVLGSRGRGLVCDLGLETRVFARLHTFGKALACSGGMCQMYLPHVRQDDAHDRIQPSCFAHPSSDTI